MPLCSEPALIRNVRFATNHLVADGTHRRTSSVVFTATIGGDAAPALNLVE